jgi:hypothetical protein
MEMGHTWMKHRKTIIIFWVATVLADVSRKMLRLSTACFSRVLKGETVKAKCFLCFAGFIIQPSFSVLLELSAFDAEQRFLIFCSLLPT